MTRTVQHGRVAVSARPRAPRNWRAWGMLCLAGVLLTFAACGATVPPSTSASPTGAPQSPPPPKSVYIVFATTVSYAQALEAITNLGLQPGFVCSDFPTTMAGPNGKPVTFVPLWQPMGQRESFARTHTLFAGTTYLMAPDDWFDRLSSLPGVTHAEFGLAQYPETGTPFAPAPGVYQCPAQAGATPSASTPVPWRTINPSQLTARISFSAPMDTYDAALAAVSQVGLGLVDPCYQRAVLNNQHPTWHAMSQQQTFAASQSLVIQTDGGFTSSLWQQQLAAMPGVTHIEAPYTAHC